MTYRVGRHHGVTIVNEDPTERCGREDHDCARGHLAAVVIDGGERFAERICQLLNGPPYPPRCTFELGVRGCMCEPWPDCHHPKNAHTPDVDYLHGVKDTLAEVRRRLTVWDKLTAAGERLDPELALAILREAAAGLGLDEDAPSAPAISPESAQNASAEGRDRTDDHSGAEGRFWGEHPAHPTCVDVTRLDQMPRSEWKCGRDCPRAGEHTEDCA